MIATYNVCVDEKLDEEKVSKSLSLTREGTEDTCWAAVENRAKTSAGEFGSIGGDLLVIHSIYKETSHERAKDLRDDVVWDLLPGEPLPDSEAQSDSWVEVTEQEMLASR